MGECLLYKSKTVEIIRSKKARHGPNPSCVPQRFPLGMNMYGGRFVSIHHQPTLEGSTRHAVTNLIDDDEQVYQTYCGRGQAENYIKAFKNAVHGDRLSCSTFAANFLRALEYALAYRLLHALRACVQPMNQPTMQFDTLRIRLLKVAAIITQSARRILVRLPESFPAREMFLDAARWLSSPAPA